MIYIRNTCFKQWSFEYSYRTVSFHSDDVKEMIFGRVKGIQNAEYQIVPSNE